MRSVIWLNEESPRALTQDDFEQMRLGLRCQGTFDPQKFPAVAGTSPHTMYFNYVENLRQMRRDGIGLVFSGSNGVGKTMAAVNILRLFRGHGQISLFARVEEIKKSYMSSDSEEQTLYRQTRDADVLLLDDLGKEYHSASDFTERFLEEFIRWRYDNKLVTLYTTNMNRTQLKENYKASTIAVLTGTTIFIPCDGEDHRQAELKSVAQQLK